MEQSNGTNLIKMFNLDNHISLFYIFFVDNFMLAI